MLVATELVWLVAAVAKGDEAAFERLYQATRAKLYGVTLRILRRPDLAEEVVAGGLCQDLAQRWRLQSSPLEPSHLDGGDRPQWCARCDTQEGRASPSKTSRARSTSRRKQSPLAQREMTEDLQRLLACMGGLEEEHRRVVLLAYYNGWSREAIGRKVRQAREHDQDVAAAQPDPDAGVPRAMSDDDNPAHRPPPHLPPDVRRERPVRTERRMQAIGAQRCVSRSRPRTKGRRFSRPNMRLARWMRTIVRMCRC